MDFSCLIRAVLLATVLGGCASEPTQPKHRGHFVLQGDTLYSVALEYDLDYLKLAKLNNVAHPYAIFPGQVIYFGDLLEQKQWKEEPDRAPSQVTATTDTKSLPATKQKATSGWGWPIQGQIQLAFGAGKPANKGIDIDSKIGYPVSASAAGEVIYAGSDIRGYGNLVILRHGADFLSAYANTQPLIVKKGERIKKGQHLTELNKDKSAGVTLHFEIRHNGNPVDPLKYLPPIK